MTVIHIADQNVLTDFFSMSKSIQLNAQAITLDLMNDANPDLYVDVFPLLRALKENPTRTVKCEYKMHLALKDQLNKIYEGNAAEVQALFDCAAETHEDLLRSLIAPPISYNAKKWSQFFDRYAAKIQIRGVDHARITVEVKSTAREWWMDYTHEGIRRDSITSDWKRANGLRFWMDKVGFPFRQKPLTNSPASVMMDVWIVEGVVAPGRGV